MKNTNIHYMLQVSDFIHRLVDKKHVSHCFISLIMAWTCYLV